MTEKNNSQFQFQLLIIFQFLFDIKGLWLSEVPLRVCLESHHVRCFVFYLMCIVHTLYTADLWAKPCQACLSQNTHQIQKSFWLFLVRFCCSPSRVDAKIKTSRRELIEIYDAVSASWTMHNIQKRVQFRVVDSSARRCFVMFFLLLLTCESFIGCCFLLDGCVIENYVFATLHWQQLFSHFS